MKKQELKDAYYKTSYILFYENSEITLHINEHSEKMSQILKSHDVDTFVYITAANPHSLLCPEIENQKLNSELEKDIRNLGLLYFKGIGESIDSTWREESFCVLGISLKKGMALAKNYSQNAFLYCRKKTKVRLIWAD